MVKEVSPETAYDGLHNNPLAQIIDCRTQAEWTFVGTPDLSAIGRNLVKLEWQGLNGQRNEKFVSQVEQNISKDTPIYILCRSGVRSLAACQALAASGFEQLFNIEGGFEGDPDTHGHRGQVNGWKSQGLPWRQA
ncbi:rhodanese-like domain-containing protein [Alphaproteobacteria bacterium]|nr:rhodanese-like domain-containing protein [Alphaproteobacteria bacterium]MDB2668818.1 rhodanese-like domain-containing protein [Alphaproteobacteria bacterium]MDB4106501.1 rhodanese-like domain-containing protein [bacterium]MDC0147390.1 rhodanese-like domain-containing protein [Alphaproteobacteria bacterium]